VSVSSSAERTVSVADLNMLLLARADDGKPQRIALALSYLIHAVGLLAAMLITSGRARGTGTMSVPGGVLPVHALYGLPDAVPSAADARPDRPAQPQPSPPTTPPPRAIAPSLAEPEPDRESTIAKKPPQVDKRKRTPRPAPRQTKAQAKPRASASPTPDPNVIEVPGSAPPGSPFGVIGGHRDGGLGSLMFTNQWYVHRMRAIIYDNWGNPFVGRPSAAKSLEVVIDFRIARDGRVSAVRISRASGDTRWDRAGLRAVENARLPPLPKDYRGRELRVFYRFLHPGTD